MNLSSWFKDTIYVAEKTGKNNYGDPSYSAPVAVKARVELGSKVIRDDAGNEKQSMAKIATDHEIKWSSAIWLPGESTVDDTPHTVVDLFVADNKSGGWTQYEAYL